MKTLVTIGFILILIAVWEESVRIVAKSFNFFSSLPLFTLIFGVIFIIAGFVTRVKAKINKIENLSNYKLITAILIFFSSLWLLSYGFCGINYYHLSENFLYFPEIENMMDNLTKHSIHTYNLILLIISFMVIIAGLLSISIIPNLLSEKNFGFIIVSLFFNAFASLLFSFYLYSLDNLWISWSERNSVHLTITYPMNILGYLLIPFSFSTLALILLLFQYKYQRIKLTK